MATYGYVLSATSDETLQLMKDFGCCRIFMEAKYDELSRPQRRLMFRKLTSGDCIMIPRLSHLVRACTHLSALLQYCHLREIRLVSVHDRIDTGGVLFGEVSDRNLISAFRQFPFDVNFIKTEIGEEKQQEVRISTQAKEKRMKRDEQVINMYLSGLTVEDIRKVTGVGKTTLYRILKLSNVACERSGGRKATVG